jgi:hypothetical protein
MRPESVGIFANVSSPQGDGGTLAHRLLVDRCRARRTRDARVAVIVTVAAHVAGDERTWMHKAGRGRYARYRLCERELHMLRITIGTSHVLNL